MYGNPALDVDGVQLRAVCRQLATVVTISGDVDATKLDHIAASAKRFILAEKPLVLDLSGVTAFSPQCVSLLYSIDEACFHVGVEWSLVASQPVQRALHVAGDGATFPTVASVPEAIHHFADGIGERRRLLPLLTKTA
jgi:anti-anti-sigma factor